MESNDESLPVRFEENYVGTPLGGVDDPGEARLEIVL